MPCPGPDERMEKLHFQLPRRSRAHEVGFVNGPHAKHRCANRVKEELFQCCSNVIMSGVNGNVIMSGWGDDNPDDEGREAA
jgi:hypothetical protein